MSICKSDPGVYIVAVETKHKKSSGFTLLELLASMAVLIVLIALLASVFNSVSKSFTHGLGMIDNQTRARLALDVVTRDIQAGAFRGINLTAFKDETSDAFAFFTGVPGTAIDRELSAITYRLEPTLGSGFSEQHGVLRRGSYTIDWLPSSGAKLNFVSGSTTMPLMVNSVADASRSDASTVAVGVLKFEYAFINQVTEINSSTGAKTSSSQVAFNYDYRDEASPDSPITRLIRPRYIRISMAVVNEQGLKQLVSSNQMEVLTSALDLSTSEMTSNTSIVGLWEEKFTNPSLLDTLPAAARAGLKFYERFITIPSF